MATVLQSIVNELNTVLVQLRTELRGLQTDADCAGIAIVMGPAVDAGKQPPADLQHKIKADALLGGLTIEQNDMSTARRNVRRLMADYSKQVAQAAIAESSFITASNYLHLIKSRAQAMVAAIDSIDAKGEGAGQRNDQNSWSGQSVRCQETINFRLRRVAKACGRCSAQDQSCGERSTATFRFYRKVDVRIWIWWCDDHRTKDSRIVRVTRLSLKGDCLPGTRSDQTLQAWNYDKKI